MKSRHLLALSVIPALSACGGGGDSALGNINLPGPAGFDALILEAEGLVDKADGLTISGSLPLDDGVIYDGVMIAATDIDTATEGYLGDFTATVNFDAGDMTGTGSGFYLSGIDSEGEPNTPGDPVAGTITMTSNTVGMGLFDVSLSGTLFVDDAERTINSNDGQAAFAGTNGDVFVAEGQIGFESTLTTLEFAVIAD